MITIRTMTRLAAFSEAHALPLAACLPSSGKDRDPAGNRPAPSVHQESAVHWHPQQKANGRLGRVAGASATLTRHARGVAYQFHARHLDPGHAYTLWVITVNNPGACAATPCAGPEVFAPEVDADAQVRFGAGHVVGSSGRATFAGHVSEGPLDGWLPERSLDDALTAELQFTLNDHGPAVGEYLPGMVRTYRGGCSDDSPFPGIFPDAALADGEPGPHRCLLAQATAFPAP